MQVSPWHPLDTALWVAPRQYVYTLIGKSKEGGDDMLCDYAWTKRQETAGHFWHRVDYIDCETIKLPFVEYLRRHVNEIPATNPFWDVSRLEFVVKYAKEWGGIIES